jgi:protein arginine N-methyltransferase 1
LSGDNYTIDKFGRFITDPVRTGAYAEALRRAVRPDSIVLDIGTGTGILALLACRFGARRVHAVEPDPVVALARVVAAANGYADRIVFHEGMSTDLALPERADVIVSDLYGVLPLHRARLAALADARARLLAPGGVMIPRRDHLCMAAVNAPELHEVVTRPWVDNDFGFDMSAVRDIAANQWRRTVFDSSHLATGTAHLATFDYSAPLAADLGAHACLGVERDGALHGLAAWFDADFGDGVGFSNAPGERPVIYGHAFFPWPHPVEARRGDELRVELAARALGDQYIWSWESVLGDGSGREKARFSQSTFLGMPLAPGGMERIASQHVPGLGESGRVDRLVLDAMAAGAALESIARRLQAEFPARFTRYQDALAHAGVLSVRYGQ